MATNAPDYSALVKRIAPVRELSQPLSALIYGKSGTGKTAFSATWPKPLLLLDINEKGTDTIANVEGIDVITIEEWSQFEELYWFLADGKHKYKTVVIDQITGLQGLKMAAVRAENKKEAGEILAQREWGQISGALQDWLLKYRDLVGKGVNVVFIAHEREDKPEEGADERIDPSIGPRVMPSVAATINGAVSLIGNTLIREKFTKDPETNKKTREVQYVLRIGPHAYYVTKIRRPKEFTPPDVVINPSHEKLLKLTRGQEIIRKVQRRK